MSDTDQLHVDLTTRLARLQAERLRLLDQGAAAERAAAAAREQATYLRGAADALSQVLEGLAPDAAAAPAPPKEPL